VKEGTLEECIDCKKNYECTTCKNGSKFSGKEKKAEGLRQERKEFSRTSRLTVEPEKPEGYDRQADL
jgi:hypothetical protein